MVEETAKQEEPSVGANSSFGQWTVQHPAGPPNGRTTTAEMAKIEVLFPSMTPSVFAPWATKGPSEPSWPALSFYLRRKGGVETNTT